MTGPFFFSSHFIYCHSEQHNTLAVTYCHLRIDYQPNVVGTMPSCVYYLSLNYKSNAIAIHYSYAHRFAITYVTRVALVILPVCRSASQETHIIYVTVSYLI